MKIVEGFQDAEMPPNAWRIRFGLFDGRRQTFLPVRLVAVQVHEKGWPCVATYGGHPREIWAAVSDDGTASRFAETALRAGLRVIVSTADDRAFDPPMQSRVHWPEHCIRLSWKQGLLDSAEPVNRAEQRILAGLLVDYERIRTVLRQLSEECAAGPVNPNRRRQLARSSALSLEAGSGADTVDPDRFSPDPSGRLPAAELAAHYRIVRQAAELAARSLLTPGADLVSLAEDCRRALERPGQHARLAAAATLVRHLVFPARTKRSRQPPPPVIRRGPPRPVP